MIRVDVLLICLNFVVMTCGSAENEKQYFARILPRVTLSKSSTIRSFLILNDYPPSGSIITAQCSLLSKKNASDKSSPANCLSNPSWQLLPKSKRSTDVELRDENATLSKENNLSKRNRSTEDSDSWEQESSAENNHPTMSHTPLWKLLTPTVSFTDSLSEPIIAVRDGYPDVREIEELVLTCCLLGPEVMLASSGHGSANDDHYGILVVDASPPVSVNWSAAPAIAASYPDRKYSSPAYVDVAPCPCDLMPESCDVNCCCDQSCSNVAISGFNCQSSSQHDFEHELSCLNRRWTSYHHPTDQLRPLLCLHSSVADNSPYLGTYYPTNPPIRQRRAALLPATFRNQMSLTPPTVPTDQYRYGTPIVTIVGGAAALTGLLALPATTFDGKCVLDTSPVAFLVPSSDTCVLPALPLFCSDQSPWSISAYLSNNSSHIRVLVNPTNPDQTANITVNYICEHGDVTSAEGNDCDWLSGAIPRYEAGVCRNVVSRVRYVVAWDGGRLLNIDVTIALRDVRLLDGVTNSDRKWSTTVTQNYEVSFVHRPVRQVFNDTSAGGDVTVCGNDTSSTTTIRPVFRSGNPGYEFGKPLLIGRPVDACDVVVADGNWSDFRAMNLGAGHADGLIFGDDGISCGKVGRSIEFGVNSYSGCRLVLSTNESTTSCSLLRHSVLKQLCDFAKSTYVSRGGNPDPSNKDDFIPIIRNDLCQTLNSSSQLQDATDDRFEEMGVCANVPSHLGISVLYGQAGYLDGATIFQVQGMRTSNANSTWQRCANPSNKGSCSSSTFGSNHTTIYLTMSVDFVFVPVDQQKNTKKFWAIQNSLPCSQDKCWSQIAYPFTGAPSGDSRSYVTKWGAVLSVMFLIVLFITRGAW